MRPEKEIRERLEKLKKKHVFSSFGIKRATDTIISTLKWVLGEKELPRKR